MKERDPTPAELAALNRRVAASPISALVKNFQASPFAGAPERQTELNRHIVSLGTRIQLAWPGTEFVFGVGENNAIYVGLCGLERLWAYAFGYYRSYLLAGNHPPAVIVQRPAAVVDLMKWAHTGANSPIETPWPAGTARPDQPNSGNDIATANEIFLMMSAWILLHEVAHIIRQDAYDKSPGGQAHNHAIEFAADDWAYRFLLDHWRSYSTEEDVLLKRGIGIAFAIFILSADRYFKGGVVGSHTHPHPVDRLLRFFDYLETSHAANAQAVSRIEHAACICLFGTIGPNLPATATQQSFATPRACVEFLRRNFQPLSV